MPSMCASRFWLVYIQVLSFRLVISGLLSFFFYPAREEEFGCNEIREGSCLDESKGVRVLFFSFWMWINIYIFCFFLSGRRQLVHCFLSFFRVEGGELQYSWISAIKLHIFFIACRGFWFDVGESIRARDKWVLFHFFF